MKEGTKYYLEKRENHPNAVPAQSTRKYHTRSGKTPKPKATERILRGMTEVEKPGPTKAE